ncbi:MAG: hypothetical protein WDN29_07760 [Methylovirgula sp.]
MGTFNSISQNGFDLQISANTNLHESAGFLGVNSLDEISSTGSFLHLQFGANQTAVNLGVATDLPGNVTITIKDSSGNSSTENVSLGGQTTIVIDSAHWQGSNSFLSGFDEIDISPSIGPNFQNPANFSLKSVIYNAEQSASVLPSQLDFGISAVDGDGSTSSQQTLAINLVNPPLVGTGPFALNVSESALPSGSNPNPGDQNGTVTNTFQVSFTAGTDDAHVTLQSISLSGAISGLSETVVSGTEIDVYQQLGGAEVEIATLVLSGTTTIGAGTAGAVTVTETLLAPIDGNNGGGAGDLGTLNVIASDANNSAINATDQVSVGVIDDTPTMTSISSGTVDAANPSLSGAWAGSFGADGPNSTTPFNLVMGSAPAGFTYTTLHSNIIVDGHAGGFEEQISSAAGTFTFFAYTQAVNVNGVAGEEMFAFANQGGTTPFFELTVFDNKSYTFHLDTTSLPSGVPVSKEATFTSLVGAQGDNSDAFLDFVNGAGTFNSSSQSGVDLQISAVNSQSSPVLDAFSGGELGAGASDLPDGSTFDFQFGTNQTSVALGVVSVGGSGITTTITIENSAGQSSIETITLNGSTQTINIDAYDWTGGATNLFQSGFDEIIIAPAHNGAVSLTSVTYNAEQSVSVTPSQLDFGVSAVDGDGSTSSQQTLAVTLAAPVPPVANPDVVNDKSGHALTGGNVITGAGDTTPSAG